MTDRWATRPPVLAYPWPVAEARTQGLLVTAAKWVEPHVASGLLLVGPILMGVAPLIQGNWWKLSRTLVFVLIGFALAMTGFVLQREERDRLRKVETSLGTTNRKLVESERSEREAERRLDDSLQVFVTNWFHRLGLGTFERISVYAHDGGRGFIQLLRYAPNRAFAEVGRNYYPDDEGLLGKAWADGVVYKADAPGRDDPQRYRDYHIRLGLDPAAVDDLSMPSRAYLGHAVDQSFERVGVVMLESTRPRGLTAARNRITDQDLVSVGLLIVLARPPAEVEAEMDDEGGDV